MKLQIAATNSARTINEDKYGVFPNKIFVLDGATGLSVHQYMPEGNDTRWFVDQISEALSNTKDSHDQILPALRIKIQEMIQEYKQYAPLQKATMPSCCMCLFYETKDKLWLYQIGDCTAVIEKKDHTLEVIYDHTLVALDQKVITTMQKLAKEKNIAFFETKPLVKEMLLQHRLLRNEANGYGALDLSFDWMSKLHIQSWKKEEVHRILCMSDGFYEIMQYGIYDKLSDLLDAIEEKQEAILQVLCDAQDKDRKAICCPRFKHRDDMTFVYAKL